MKTAPAAKTVTIKIRVDPVEHRELEWAAKEADLPLSTWLRALGRQAYRALAEKKKKKP